MLYAQSASAVISGRLLEGSLYQLAIASRSDGGRKARMTLVRFTTLLDNPDEGLTKISFLDITTKQTSSSSTHA